jgi:hypothetical protein
MISYLKQYFCKYRTYSRILGEVLGNFLNSELPVISNFSLHFHTKCMKWGGGIK